MVYLWALLMFPIIALFKGFYNYQEIELIIDINLLKSGYFKMGIFHEPFTTNTYRIDTLTFGMLLVEIEIRFIKELNG
jgi:hypothetical protein